MKVVEMLGNAPSPSHCKCDVLPFITTPPKLARLDIGYRGSRLEVAGRLGAAPSKTRFGGSSALLVPDL